MTDGSPIDTTVFTVAPDTKQLDVFTTDPTKATFTYQFTIKVTLPTHPENPGSSKDFTILVDNSCEDSLDIIPAAAPTDEIYDVARPAIVSSFDEFTVSLIADPDFFWFDECPFTYKSSITPVLVAPDNTAIDYDSVTRTFTTFTNNIAIADVYTVTVTLVRPSGTESPSFGFSFQITIVDPCISATLTIDPTIFPTPYEYVISQAKDIQTLLDSSVSSDETDAVCPDIIFSVKNRDTTPIDPLVFVYNSLGQTLETETSDKTKVALYPMTLFA